MKRIDLSGFDAEFPPIKRNPNETTIGSKLEDMSADLKYLAQMMIADDSDDIAEKAMKAKRAVDDLLRGTRTIVDGFPLDWWPSE